MPRLTQSTDMFFRMVMLPRAPSCVFKQEDIELITKETGYTRDFISNWECRLRWQMSNNSLPGNISVVDYLTDSVGALYNKVI